MGSYTQTSDTVRPTTRLNRVKMVRVSVRHDTTIVMVGDCKVGKTSLVNKFRMGKFDASYTRTGFETLTTSTVLQGTRVKFTIYDTTGSHGSNTSREIAYREADIFLLCYKISDISTLFSAGPRAQELCPGDTLRAHRVSVRPAGGQGRHPGPLQA